MTLPRIDSNSNRASLSASSPVRTTRVPFLLPNGKGLIAGGSGVGQSTLNSAELYDPTAGTFSSTGSLIAARDGNGATLLPKGKVLFAGGGGGYVGVATEIYDPASGTFSATGSLVAVRNYDAATVLLNGRVLLARGQGVGATYLSSAELYDPGFGFPDSRRPVVSAPTTLVQSSAFALTGTGFRGDSGRRRPSPPRPRAHRK